MQPAMPVDRIVELARQLSPLEKLKLIKQLAPDLEAALVRDSNSPAVRRPRRALRGILRGCAIGDSEIQEIREEMWRAFPRENLS
jgi:hypothetical protein